MAKVGYQLDPVNLRASFAMGSGDDNATMTETAKNSRPSRALTTEQPQDLYTIHRFMSVQSALRLLRQLSQQHPAAIHNNTGIANTTYYNLGVDVTPMKELGISLDGYLLRATKTGGWEDVVSEAAGEM